MVLFLLIFTVCSILLIFFKKLSRSENVMLSKAISNHNQLVCALTQKAFVDQHTALTEDEERKIVTMAEADWNEWNNLITKMHKFYSSNPFLVNDFLKDYFPNIQDRTLYKKLTSNGSKMSKNEAAIRSLSFEEIKVLDSMTEDDWNKRKTRLKKINNIINHNADGIKTYKEIKKLSSGPNNTLLLRDQNLIEHLQKCYVISNQQDDWLKRQESFCAKYRSTIIECNSNAGCYTYDVPFNKIRKDGTSTKSKFKIWQSFSDSYSPYHLEEQSDSMVNTYRKLDNFKNRQRYYYEYIYERIFHVIQKIEEDNEEKPLVVFINNCPFEWAKETYDYHYNHLKSLLDDNNFPYVNIDRLYLLDTSTNYKTVIIVDFITSNDELYTNCNLIVSFFKDFIPTIGYHTILKEYSDTEVKEIIDKKRKKERIETPPAARMSTDEERILYVKTILLRANKAERFSYYALSNVLIGNGVKSGFIKPVWLDSPDDIKANSITGDGKMGFAYSLNGVKQPNFTIEGDTYSIEDVSKFTYLFLKKIGVWEQFVNKGEDAIRKMNEIGVLSR